MNFAAGKSAEPTSKRSPGYHPEWVSVGEALSERPGAVVEKCRVVGRDLAERGVPVREALEELRSTIRLSGHREPSFEECSALSEAWADATLGYLNRLSCSDPLTGLESQAHLVSLLGVPSQAELMMVILEVPRPQDFFALAQQLSLLGETCRTVFPLARATARIGVRRLVVLTPGGPDFNTRLSLLSRCVEGDGRVLAEQIGSDTEAAIAVIDRLARD